MNSGKLLVVIGLLLVSSATRAEEWTLPAEPGHLAGTLLTPDSPAPWPVALLEQGIASLRVDKRGVAGSISAGRSEYDLSFDDFISDAAAWCGRLQADERFGSVAVVGHSQGALVSMNHVLKMVPDGNNYAQQASLVDSTLEIAPEVPLAVAELVRQAEALAKNEHEARVRLLKHATTAPRLYSVTVEDSLLAAEYSLPTAEKMSRWALRFAQADSISYLFGPKPGGYVATGALVDDHRQDCVSLLYRISELARARDARDAVLWALRTRFAGAEAATVVDEAGRVNYDDPAHLDYSLDMIRSGLWGRNITDALSGARADTVGSSRYAAGSFSYVPKSDLVSGELAAGDVVWFVLAPGQAKAAKLRQEYGLVIGHIGVVVEGDGEPILVHAAVSDLPGWYEGGTVVTVPLVEYLARVAKFAGVIVTRF